MSNHEFNPAVTAIREKLAENVTIDDKGNVTFSIKASELYPADGSVSEESLKASLAHLNHVAVGAADVFQTVVNKAAKKDKELKDASGELDGPIRGSKLKLGWTRERSGSVSGKEYVSHGSLTASWNGLGGPAGKDYAAVKEASKEAASKL